MNGCTNGVEDTDFLRFLVFAFQLLRFKIGWVISSHFEKSTNCCVDLIVYNIGIFIRAIWCLETECRLLG